MENAKALHLPQLLFAGFFRWYPLAARLADWYNYSGQWAMV